MKRCEMSFNFKSGHAAKLLFVLEKKKKNQNEAACVQDVKAGVHAASGVDFLTR